jgi:hypothetical protein
MKTKTSLAMLALLFAVETAFAITGAIFTTNSTCSGVDIGGSFSTPPRLTLTIHWLYLPAWFDNLQNLA